MEEPITKRSGPGNSAMALLALAIVGALVWVAYSLNKQVNPDITPPPVSAVSNKPAIDPVAGLPPNPDFEQLPGLSAVWADQAEWKNGARALPTGIPATIRSPIVSKLEKRSAAMTFAKFPDLKRTGILPTKKMPCTFLRGCSQRVPDTVFL
jgi:hypothetical protein